VATSTVQTDRQETQMSILDEVQKEVAQLTPEQVQAEFQKLMEQRAKRQEKQREYNARPENKEKRAEYAKQYRERDPEAFKRKRAEYMKRPEVVEKRKAYMKARNERIKLLLQKAKELGFDKQNA
jgi:thioredoxin-like negative regulator of GroEL